MCDGDGRDAYERRVKRDYHERTEGVRGARGRADTKQGGKQGGRSELELAEGSSLFQSSTETLTPSSARISLDIGFLPRILTAVRATSLTEGGAHASEGG